MQLYESSFYSFVSAEVRNWLPEIIGKEKESRKEGSWEIPHENVTR